MVGTKAFLRGKLGRRLDSIWYEGHPPHFLLVRLEKLYVAGVGARRAMYRCRLKKIHRLPVPVIVVGNLSVGGTGKTPLVIWLAEFFKRLGYAPGIISRGYGGNVGARPRIVGVDSHPKDVGDEAVLMATRTDCPVTVATDRVAAARAILTWFDSDLIISDDGLQHYGLARELEIAVVDGVRRHGNGYCLPAGPLREPLFRLHEVDMIVCNGAGNIGEFPMEVEGDTAVSLADGSTKKISDFRVTRCHALAGIGNPKRFFDHLSSYGLSLETHTFVDHHQFHKNEITFNDQYPVLMTEKDAVKCRRFASDRHWYVPICATLKPEFGKALLKILREKDDG